MNKKNNLKKKDYSQAIILAIDTSCDDTSVAILQNRRVLANIVSSQIELHKKWGGVVPSIARQAHRDNIERVYKEALKRARPKESDLDIVAVCYGPGLAIALEVGIDFAKTLSMKNNLKLVPVNHMEGHLLSPFLLNSKGNGQAKLVNNFFPALALLVSGNHSEIVFVKEIGDYEILGETLDDAAGEAFDKVARMLNLSYPGGPIITHLAKRADKSWRDVKKGRLERADKKPEQELAGFFGLPIPMYNSGDLNFSFSGLKTASLYKIAQLRKEYKLDKDWSYNFSREFINAISLSLQQKLKKAIKLKPEAKTIIIGGGVSNNCYILRDISLLARKNNLKFLKPDRAFRSDNAAMIAIAAYYQLEKFNNYLSGEKIKELDRMPNLKLS